MALVERAVEVSFGDCDPAGIVFHPTSFRSMDATFHRHLQERAGGHGRLCRLVSVVGVGLMDVDPDFPIPVRDGRRIVFRVTGIDQGRRRLTLRYEADREVGTALEGHERRGIFLLRDGRMTGAETGPLRARIGAENARPLSIRVPGGVAQIAEKKASEAKSFVILVPIVPTLWKGRSFASSGRRQGGPPHHG